MCSRPAASPTISRSRASTFMCTSSRAGSKAKAPPSISDITASSPSRIASASVSETMPVAPSIAAWAREPSTSWGASLRSKETDALMAWRIASGPPSKRPPHMSLAESLGSGLSSGLMGSSPGRDALLKTAALYIAMGLFANGAEAQGLADLAVGEMAALTVHAEPKPVPEAAMQSPDGAAAALPKGRPAVVNFWATWCAPCLEEMPTLAGLHEAMGDEVAVVVVATGRNDPERAAGILAETGADALIDLRDPRGLLGRGVGVVGLPTTLVLDARGREVARLQGVAEWDSEDAQALLRALAGG